MIRVGGTAAVALVAAASAAPGAGARSVVAAACPSGSAVRGYVKLDGIPGDSVNARHPGEIDAISVGFAGSATGPAGGGGGGGVPKPAFTDVTFTKRTDKATALLLQHVALGKHLRTGRIALECGTQPVLLVEMTDVRVSKAATDWQSGLPKEQVALAYAKVCWTAPGAARACIDRPA